MTVGTAFVDSFTATTGTWTPYNNGTAVAGSAVPFLSDTSATTWVQATTLSGGQGVFTSGLGNVTTGGSAIIRVRPVLKISRGDGSQTSFRLVSSGYSIASNAVNPSASGETTFNGGWVTSATANTAWSTAAANALTLEVTTTSSAQRVTQASFEYDLQSIPTATPVVADVTTDRPTISWTWSDADGIAQYAAVVKVFSAAQTAAPGFSASTSTPLWSGTATTGTSITPGSAIVTSGLVYRPYLQVAKYPYGIRVESAWTAAAAASTASFSVPTAPTLNLTWDANNRRTVITVAGSASPFRYTILRGTATIGTALDVMGASGSAVAYDYTMPRGTAVVYSATISTAATATLPLTSAATLGTITTGTAVAWELRAVEYPTEYANFTTPVTGISWERYEGLGIFRPLGSTGAVVVSGDMGLDDGSLEITTSTRADWETVKSLIGIQGPLLLTSPFRGVDGANERIAIRLTSRSWDSDGTLTTPIQRLTASFVGVDLADFTNAAIRRAPMSVSHRVVSVGTAAVSLNVVEADMNPGQQLVASVSSGTAYLGGSAVTSSSYGFALTPGVAFSADLGSAETLYAVAASGTVSVYVIATGA